jgi:hypothetical protein
MERLHVKLSQWLDDLLLHRCSVTRRLVLDSKARNVNQLSQFWPLGLFVPEDFRQPDEIGDRYLLTQHA